MLYATFCVGGKKKKARMGENIHIYFLKRMHKKGNSVPWGSGWQRQGRRENFHFISLCTFLNFEPHECITYSKYFLQALWFHII